MGFLSAFDPLLDFNTFEDICLSDTPQVNNEMIILQRVPSEDAEIVYDTVAVNHLSYGKERQPTNVPSARVYLAGSLYRAPSNCVWLTGAHHSYGSM